jgi:hypothetical protein
MPSIILAGQLVLDFRTLFVGFDFMFLQKGLVCDA